MKGLMAVGLLLALGAVSASDAFAADGRSGGGRAVGRAGGPGARSGSAPGGGSHGAYAVPRGYGGGGYAPPTGAQYRHPRAGTGTGGYYYRHGHGHYPYYGRYPYYGYYPYWGYYSYPGYGLPGLGLSFYFGDGYAAPYYSAPYYVGPPAASVGYYGGGYYGGGGGYESAPAPSDAAVLLLEVVPDDASVWIDDEFRGVARDLARVALPPGRHRVEVVRPGFRTAAEEVDLGPGSATSLRIELERP
jgi:PEGA domain-containing protein